MGRKSPIEEYLDKHPDSTLREYNEYVKEEERKRHQEKVDRHGLGPCAVRVRVPPTLQLLFIK